VGDLLKKLFPQLSLAELALRAIGVLLVMGLIAWGFFTVKGWHDDSLALPAVKAQLAQKTGAYDALVGRMTATLDVIPARLDALDAWRADIDRQLTANRVGIKGAVDQLLKRYPHAFQNDPACPEPSAVRGGMLQLFPLYRPDAGSPGARSSEGGRETGPSGTAGAAPSVPGRQRSPIAEGSVGMSAVTGNRSGAAVGVATGTGGTPDPGAADRDGPAVPVESGADWRARVRRALAGTLSTAWNIAVETAQDDRRDGR
jgi:hypothetical protein